MLITFAEDSAGAIFAHTCSFEMFPSKSILNDSLESYEQFVAIMNRIITIQGG